ncbi:MAG TPA: hypothetical protein VG347_15050 [Verrucomicrobiae bacterium]|nr:hypothetical protein [Verrucomicrobiae bacterium]
MKIKIRNPYPVGHDLPLCPNIQKTNEAKLSILTATNFRHSVSRRLSHHCLSHIPPHLRFAFNSCRIGQFGLLNQYESGENITFASTFSG